MRQSTSALSAPSRPACRDRGEAQLRSPRGSVGTEGAALFARKSGHKPHHFAAPIDPIPNRVPVIGHLDDAIVAMLAIALFVALVPSALRDELRADLQEVSAKDGVFARPRARPHRQERVLKAVLIV